MIISVLNQKGGVGKTTLAVNLAYAIQKRKQSKVLLIDADPQQSALDWHEAGNAEILSVIGINRPTLDRDIEKMRPHYSDIIVDGPARLADICISAIMCSDLVLIPATPSQYDIWASADIVKLIKRHQERHQEKPHAAFVISQKRNRTRLSREAKEAFQELDIPVFGSCTYMREVYKTVVGKGHTVFHKQSEEYLKAAHDIESILNELEEFVS